MIRVGITGLIGSGKSTIASIFETLGIPVYNADTEAKRLIISNSEIIESLTARYGSEVYINGEINKPLLRSKIFNQEAERLFVNSVVHPVLTDDFLKWAELQSTELVVVEAALLFEANLDKILDYTILVNSPNEISATRIADRDKISVAEAIKIINLQKNNLTDKNRPDFIINNDEKESLILQCLEVISKIKSNGKVR